MSHALTRLGFLHVENRSAGKCMTRIVVIATSHNESCHMSGPARHDLLPYKGERVVTPRTFHKSLSSFRKCSECGNGTHHPFRGNSHIQNGGPTRWNLVPLFLE